eukprot:m.110504 g.110504  ORF g.110504 m.110504 type:complete len:101 (+) comp9222_c0_seq1:212-514(+)
MSVFTFMCELLQQYMCVILCIKLYCISVHDIELCFCIVVLFFCFFLCVCATVVLVGGSWPVDWLVWAALFFFVCVLCERVSCDSCVCARVCVRFCVCVLG